MKFSIELLFSVYTLILFLDVVNALTGDATYYQPGLGACGFTSNDNQPVVALSVAQYGSGARCRKNIRVQYQGKTVTAMVVDKCPGCAGNSIDLSSSAFKRLAATSVGRIQVTWNYA